MREKILQSSEASLLNQTMSTEGWKVVEKVFDEIFTEKYSKLRKCNRDSAFYKLQGGLDTIDGIRERLNYKLTDEVKEETDG
jgi:hypothetical protein